MNFSIFRNHNLQSMILLLCFFILSTSTIGCGEEDTDGNTTDGDFDTETDTAIDGDNTDDDTADSDSTDMDLDLIEIEAEEEMARFFYFAVITDTHIIDEFYEGPEGNKLDTESVFHSKERMIAARDAINAFDPPIEQVFIPGDGFHNYPSYELDFFYEHTTRVDHFAEVLDGFEMPVQFCPGNHDYDLVGNSFDFSKQLISEKLGYEPYYEVDHKGWKFLMMNNFLGDTQNPNSAEYAKEIGSFGQEQLGWLENQLKENMPTILFFHFGLFIIKADEFDGFGIKSIANNYPNIKHTISGHTHRWMDFKKPDGKDLLFAPSLICAATRYDADNIAYFEVDLVEETFRMLDSDCQLWGGMFATPYKFGESCDTPIDETPAELKD